MLIYNRLVYSKMKGRGDLRKEQAFVVFMGGIGRNVSEDDLAHYFSQFGLVVRVALQLSHHLKGNLRESNESPRKSHRGSGFLYMKDEEAYQRILTLKYHYVQTAFVECRPSLSKKERKTYTQEVLNDARKVFIGGLPQTISKHTIYDFFSRLVDIEDITLINKENREYCCCFLLLRTRFSGYSLYGNEYTLKSGVTVVCQEALTPQQIHEKQSGSTIEQHKLLAEITFLNHSGRIQSGHEKNNNLSSLDERNIIKKEKIPHLLDVQLNHGPENVKFNKHRLHRPREERDCLSFLSDQKQSAIGIKIRDPLEGESISRLSSDREAVHVKVSKQGQYSLF